MNGKKNVQRRLDGLLPIFQLWVAIQWIVSQQARAQARNTTEQHPHDTTQQRCDMAGLHAAASSARARVLTTVCRDTKFFIEEGGSLVVSRHGAQVLRHGAAIRPSPRHSARHSAATRQEAHCNTTGGGP